MKIKEGEWYKTRSNTIVGPVERTSDTTDPYWIPRANFACYQSNGMQSVSGWVEGDNDLLEQVDGQKYVAVYNALNSEFGFFIASIVCGMLHIHLSKEITLQHLEESGLFTKELEEDFREKFYRITNSSDNAKAAYDLALECWRVSYDWQVRQSLQGMGGCKAKTFKELIKF